MGTSSRRAMRMLCTSGWRRCRNMGFCSAGDDRFSDMSRSLKILVIMHMRWARHIGAPRVSFELAEEFRALGHSVDKFDIEDALGPQKGKLAAYFHETLFARK